MRTAWGFDTKDLDSKVRPQDDFYHYASGSWLARHPIPANESRWGSFTMLRYETDLRLRAILTKLESARCAKGSPEQMIRDFFRSGMNEADRTKQGTKPLLPWLTKIRAMKNDKDLLATIAALHRIGVGVLFGSATDQDSKQSTKYILHVYQDGLGMPDRDYYLKNDAESKRVRSAYLLYLPKVLKLIGLKKGEAARATQVIMEIETKLAKASMKKEDRRDAEKTYHKKTPKELQKLAPAVDWYRYFALIGAKTPKAVIAMQPEFLKAVSKIIKETPLEDLKIYFAFHLVNDYAGYLSPAFVRTSFSFYGTVLGGTKKMRPLWRRVLTAVNGNLGELLGKIYVKQYFPPAAKREMNRLVDDLFEAYENRLKGLDWMSKATKKKAVRKLHAMNRKIGYPDKWKSYTGLVIRPDEYAGNALRASEFEHRRDMRKLAKPIDRGEWFMFPQTVNAYFAPNLNDIVFPAGILQPPFFDPDADDAINYGSIGTVIGHEITHGFDDQGSKFDHQGNLKSWWTKADRARFEKKAKIIEQQYSGFTVADGVSVNGKLTLGENIADLGGLAIAFDAYQLRLKKTGRNDRDGFTPEQRFFLGFTLFDRENTRPEFEKMAALTDPHSPTLFRINGPLANLNAFYGAYGVQPNHRLYRAPKVRTTVW